jgi:hypothetical protein
MQQCSDKGGAGPVAPRASPGCSASLGPAHREGGLMRWLGDGEPWRKHRAACSVLTLRARGAVGA